MEHRLIVDKLERMITERTNNSDIEQNADLMAHPTYFQPFKMAALFLDIQQEFSIDLNELVPRLDLFTPRAIIEEVLQLVSNPQIES